MKVIRKAKVGEKVIRKTAPKAASATKKAAKKNFNKVAWKKTQLGLPAQGDRWVVLDGVRIWLPRIEGTPKYHTEEEIRLAVRDYFREGKSGIGIRKAS